MNNAIDKLRGLLNLHQRAAGHSTATVKIANEVNALMVVADRNQMQQPMGNFMAFHSGREQAAINAGFLTKICPPCTLNRK